MLTQKGKNGLKAVIYLARQDPEEMCQSDDIARGNNISKKFLDGILATLRMTGIVQSRKGPSGGYRLARPSKDIMVGSVIRALDGPLAPIACASRTAYQPCSDCQDIASCAVRRIMTEVRDAIANVLDQTSVHDLASEGCSTTRNQILGE